MNPHTHQCVTGALSDRGRPCGWDHCIGLPQGTRFPGGTPQPARSPFWMQELIPSLRMPLGGDFIVTCHSVCLLRTLKFHPFWDGH